MPWRSVLMALIISLAGVGTPGAQTCSCARTAAGSGLEGKAVGAGAWHLGFAYEYHPITDVFAGSEEIVNDSRRRISHTGLLEATYGLSERWSITTQLTFTQQERHSAAVAGFSESLRTRGVGDALLLVRYNAILPTGGRRLQVSAGGGLEVPVGSSSLTNNGTLIAADMQPGSGSWDALLWGHISHYLTADYAARVFVTAAYRAGGSSDRGGSFSSGYRTGNELTVGLGISNRFTSRLEVDAGIQVRHAVEDRVGAEPVPNTGGTWLNIDPGLNLILSEAFTLRLAGQIPVFRDIDGIQATTSYLASVAVYYTFAPKQVFGIQP